MKKSRLVIGLVAMAMLTSMAGCKKETSNTTTKAPEVQQTSGSSQESKSAPTETSSKEDFPKDVLHIVVTFSAGGGNDLIARATAAAMEEVGGCSVVVDNITGAGGMTGTQEVVSASPDGYTILCQDSSLTSMLVTQKPDMGLEDLEPIASVYSCPTWVLSHSDRGYEDLQAFVDNAKAHPGELTIGTAVTTGAQYLMGCAIADYFDLDVTIIPYSGGNELKAAILGNQVDIGVVHSPILLPEVQEGMVKVLAAGAPLTEISDESLRDIPTLADYGMDVEFSSTRGFFVPKGTPESIVTYLEDLISKSVDANAMKEFATSFGFGPSYQNGENYRAFLEDEVAGYQEVFDSISK